MSSVQVNFSANTACVAAGVSKIQGSLKGLKSTVTGITSALSAGLAPVLLTIGALGGGLAVGVADVLDFAGGLNDLSTATGVGVEKLVVYKEALRECGKEGEDLADIFASLTSRITKPKADTTAWLEKFGLDAKALKDGNVGDAFEAVGAKIGGLKGNFEKVAASNAMFGKGLGLSLVPLFKTSTALQDAARYTGQLGATMAANTSVMDDIGDAFTGIHTKALQFFGGFTAANLGPLGQMAEYIKDLDLTDIGEKVGKALSGLFNAFKNGNLREALWDGFKWAIQRMGEELLAVLSYAGQMLAKAFKDSLKNLKVGGVPVKVDDGQDANLKFTPGAWAKGGFMFTPEAVAASPQKTFQEIRDGFKNFFGSNDSGQKYLDETAAKNPAVPFSAELRAKLFPALEEFKTKVEAATEAIDFRQSESRGTLLDNLGGILDFARTFKPGEGAANPFAGYRPTLSSIASIGGAAAFTNNPQVDLHRETNKILVRMDRRLETIANNDGGGEWR